MAQYRKKPVVIEAEQWWPGKDVPGVLHEEDYTTEDLDGERFVKNRPYVVTMHKQRVYLEPGDWVIAEPNGVHFYPCKPSVFETTYERVL